ncbi:hypothetical protein DVA67_007465 [Solirubrobacter sp. CPCC 204708]|uniref:Class I SAM-dependent methyltransferase n=1 Tax=Solirubrobacter deserti TaxID=2282478 RepID=A0ABT4RJX5_9ACTN|nr:hypothetical protein [Solirubrobacter deserti]MBE2315809.1 hypothetical protein [Solirubrobacter deserti]MDA0138855.1 hypothetical protein [Solirubrobacter deserti]
MDRTLAANARRNANGGLRRLWRWRSARDAAWTLLDRHVARGATVAVVGAGNGHDLPLRRLGRRAGRLDLIDLDAAALRGTQRRLLLTGVRARTITQDVTGGAAEAIVRAVVGGRSVRVPPAPQTIGRPPYDVVIADQFLSQLLYPALSDSQLSRRFQAAALRAHGQSLTNAVVRDLLIAGALVVLIEDVLGWWEGHVQPFTLEEVLAAPEPLGLMERGRQPRGCDGRAALAAAGAQVVDRAVWQWPFRDGTDYLVCATVAVSG